MHADTDKAIRLTEFIKKTMLLRTSVVRDLQSYRRTLWLAEIPRQKGCFAQAWGENQADSAEVWLEVQSRQQPEPPAIPERCEGWVMASSLKDKTSPPQLLATKLEPSSNLDPAGSSKSVATPFPERLEDHPELPKIWDRYLKEHWQPWVANHNLWETVHKVYSQLFRIQQDINRLGEEYELVIGIGLLTWKTPGGQQVRRHLVAANATLEFEPALMKFTVRAHPEGARLRPELDMLEVDEQPQGAEEIALNALAGANDDPWQKEVVTAALQGLVNSLDDQGSYLDTLAARNSRPSPQPIVEYAPALILRKRSARGITQALNKIENLIANKVNIPSQYATLAELEEPTTPSNESRPASPGANSVTETEIYFPKPTNSEQLRIARLIDSEKVVLVQGPPGTGKSHTIANLICHLLATGQRILITAKTPRALQVLQGLIPEELQPLCINVIGEGAEETRSLEASVKGILNRDENWDQEQDQQDLEDSESTLQDLKKERAELERRLRTIRESETHVHHLAGGTYFGTAARIVQAVNRDRPEFTWFQDQIDHNDSYPLSGLSQLLSEMRYFTATKRQELDQNWPETLPDLNQFASLTQAASQAASQERIYHEGVDEQIANLLVEADPDALIDAIANLSAHATALDKALASKHQWLPRAIQEVAADNQVFWRTLANEASIGLGKITAEQVEVADHSNIELGEGLKPSQVLEDALVLKEHFEHGGKTGWWVFRPNVIKDHLDLIRNVKLNGRSCTSAEDFAALHDRLYVELEVGKLWQIWAQLSEAVPGSYQLQLAALKSMQQALRDVLALSGSIDSCRQALVDLAPLSQPNWANLGELQKLIHSSRLGLELQKSRAIASELNTIKSSIVFAASKPNSHPAVRALRDAIDSANIEEFIRASSTIEELSSERRRLRALDRRLAELEKLLPLLTRELRPTCAEPYWDKRFEQMEAAWHWAQARYWAEEYIKQEDLPAISNRLQKIDRDIGATVAKIAALKAWSFCLTRIQDGPRKHMESWRQAMKRLGKGTGKHANQRRHDAQYHLNQARPAIPAWIMPLHRVWDTVDTAPELFDVIIIDEASQCGLESLPLLFLGKKIVIVGDDQQISPEMVGVSRDAAQRLMEEQLYDFEHKSSFDIEASLFDFGKLHFGKHRVTLREHFRCMPEIIEFSNKLCYSDTPLIPLRQYGPDRLPPLQSVFVAQGYREGERSRVINPPEAKAICERIVELCSDSRYRDKTMGVITLQGDNQAQIIEQLLLENLGAAEIERRRIVCGDPYSFQGDERDVIFLSMVAAPNERIGTLSKATDQRRFNVAASRAKDQLWLFYSAKREDLSTQDLRRRLVAFFEDSRPRQVNGIDLSALERQAHQDNRLIQQPPEPFESWFEVDVALRILRRGFAVTSQYPVAGKRIDLVIEGGQGRLAIECDGDHWHGADKYEEDMQRQRQLERCGWEFFRVRESYFYASESEALKGLWPLLEQRGIFPTTFASLATS